MACCAGAELDGTDGGTKLAAEHQAAGSGSGFAPAFDFEHLVAEGVWLVPGSRDAMYYVRRLPGKLNAEIPNICGKCLSAIRTKYFC